MIRVDNLEYTYSKSRSNAVKNISFHIPKGVVFGFLGPSGAGKTTTQKLITGLLRDYIGSIHIEGRERKDWDNSFYEKIGVVFEFPNLYLKLTGEENLNLFGSYYK
ncbi:MAG: ATP-binding cassette domain-containing protein, partial [Clostridiales bacterium]|nr:ATP-binding cassette domain-containing protein [Clostridiales bacterium]